MITQQQRKRKPRIFVGSGVEGLPVVGAIHRNLARDCELTPWHQGFEIPGEGFWETLVRRAVEFDFSIIVVAGAEDLVDSRGKQTYVVRANLLLEAGLFIGALGRHRTFIVHDRRKPIAFPSDLEGIVLISYEHNDRNLQAAVGEASAEILESIKRLGLCAQDSVDHPTVPFELHHVSLPVRSIKKSTAFYVDLFQLEILDRGRFNELFRGTWFRFRSGQHLHLVQNRAGTFRTSNDIEPRDTHFAVRVKSISDFRVLLAKKRIRCFYAGRAKSLRDAPVSGGGVSCLAPPLRSGAKQLGALSASRAYVV
jgi:catechol 2,3-dioxygenase-like lactoylglutathione lyase family enzyme